MEIVKKHSIVALGYFVLIAILGVLLRAFFVTEIPANYRYIVHTHSHIALLGWVYTALTTIIYFLFLKGNLPKQKYKTVFWLTQLGLIGMLCTFPFMGYALFSIVFSTLFILISYYFTYCFIKYTTLTQKATQAYRWVRTALWFMVFSNLGPLSLGLIMNTAGKGSALYKNSIYFYLHFQYNGWFIVALLGILVFILEKLKIKEQTNNLSKIYWYFNIGVVLTFLQSLLWMENTSNYTYIFTIVGAILQLVAFGMLIRYLSKHWTSFRSKITPTTHFILQITAGLFLLKLLMQLVGSFPFLASIVTTNIDLVIGYLHWIFLGVVSVSLFGFLNHFKMIRISKKMIIAYLIGFLLTELLIFYRGLSIFLPIAIFENFTHYLFVASILLLAVIIAVFVVQFQKRKAKIFEGFKN